MSRTRSAGLVAGHRGGARGYSRLALRQYRPHNIRYPRLAVVLARDHSLAFYDALILAAAIEAGCETLYSEDFQHGRRFGDCTIVNPFL